MTDDLPRLADLPIPDDVRPDRSWSELMLHMAAHIGPRATLALCDRHGGRVLAVSPNTVERLADVLTPVERTNFAHAFAGERLSIPVASRPILHAKRAGIVAAVRAGRLTGADAAVICRTPRRHISKLVNQTQEGSDAAPIVPLPQRAHDPRQLDMFADHDD